MDRGASTDRDVSAVTDAATPHLTLADVPALAAALGEALGDWLVIMQRAAQVAAERLKAVAAQLSGWLEESRALDFLADVLDEALLWAGGNGRDLLIAVDTDLLGVQVADYYGDLGVYRPLAPQFVRDALERSDQPDAGDRAEVLASVGPGSADWEWISSGLLSSPSLGWRCSTVAHVIDAIQEAKYDLAVCSLFPVIEGLISDNAGVLEGKRVGLRLDRILAGEGTGTADGLGDLLARPALRAIDSELFARREFAEALPEDGALNRHLILHGRTGGYDTDEHALRLLMMVVALVELLDGPIMMRLVDQPGAFRAETLADRGPLLAVRQAGAHRVAQGAPLWRARQLGVRRAAPLGGQQLRVSRDGHRLTSAASSAH